MRGDPPLSIIGVAYTAPMLRVRTLCLVFLFALLAGAALWFSLRVSQWTDEYAAARDASLRAVQNAESVLRVGVVEHPTVYFLDPSGEAVGLEHDLAKAFAIGRRSEAKFVVFPGREAARAALANGEIDIAAIGANFGIKNNGENEIATNVRYHESAWVLLHSPKKNAPKSLAELSPARVVISARIASDSRLVTLKQKNPSVEFLVDANNDDETLIAAVGEDEIAYAIVEDDTFNASRHFHFDTQRGFIVQAPINRAWLFKRGAEALRDDANAYLQRTVRDGQMARITDRYFGFPASRRSEDFNIFSQRVNTMLPRLRSWFQDAQDAHGIEWRLLAAIAYQESHWEDNAKSETGARGVMQFTEDTAKRYNVNRDDPRSSIIGAARYLRDLKDEALATRIAEPDKTWLALAAYNIGIGHVENARILTQRNKKSPDSWPDVRKHLRELANPEVASQFKLGPCRCLMPVQFVDAVRAYYDVLLRLEPAHPVNPPNAVNVVTPNK
jgi:membrane-bound lytic murein transglycosylase F